MIFALIILYVTTLISISITERFRDYASIIAMQGWILLFIVLFKLHSIHISELLFVIIETLIFKAIVVPAMLFKIIRKTKTNHIFAAGQSQFPSLTASILALIASITTTYYIADTTTNMVFFGVALYALLSGLLLIIRRKRIFSHLVGFLVIENGVFLFSMAIGIEMPFLINIAILLDILLVVLMLGMFLSKIGTSLKNIDVDARSLTTLKN